MFKRSSKLNYVEVCFKNIESGQCTNMLQEVASEGKLVCPKGINLSTLRNLLNVPNGWIIEEKEDLPPLPPIVIVGGGYPGGGNDTPTNVEDTHESKNNFGKFIRNGHVIIVTEDGEFSINGHKL